MREILFRGKDASGIWRYGDLSFNRDKVPFIRFWSETGTYMSYEVDPETVGQSTGLTDREEKQIFEGDIIDGYYSSGKLCRYICKYNDGAFGLTWKRNVGMHRAFAAFIHVDFVVIGNIYDNPELLKEKLKKEETK